MINHASVPNSSVPTSSLANTCGQPYGDPWQDYVCTHQGDEVYNKVKVTRINGKVTHVKVICAHINGTKFPQQGYALFISANETIMNGNNRSLE